MTIARGACAVVIVLLIIGTMLAEHSGYTALESTLPIAAYSVLLLITLERIAGDGMGDEWWRAPAILGIIVVALVIPWIISAVVVQTLFVWYGRMPERPYSSWDVVLTYVVFGNIVFMYGAGMLIFLGFGIQTVRDAQVREP